LFSWQKDNLFVCGFDCIGWDLIMLQGELVHWGLIYCNWISLCCGTLMFAAMLFVYEIEKSLLRR